MHVYSGRALNFEIARLISSQATQIEETNISL